MEKETATTSAEDIAVEWGAQRSAGVTRADGVVGGGAGRGVHPNASGGRVNGKRQRGPVGRTTVCVSVSLCDRSRETDKDRQRGREIQAQEITIFFF